MCWLFAGSLMAEPDADRIRPAAKAETAIKATATIAAISNFFFFNGTFTVSFGCSIVNF